MSKTKRWIEKQMESANHPIPNFSDYIYPEQKELEAYQEYSECPLQKAYQEYENLNKNTKNVSK